MKKWKTKNGYEIIRLLSGRSNVFLLTNSTRNILIDTSIARSWPKLQRRLHKLRIDHIDYLILTHAHFDHAANAKRIKEKFNARVIIQKKEENYLIRGDNIIPRGTTLFTAPLVNFAGKRLLNKFKYEPCIPDILVDSEYSLKESGFEAYLMHTPGHTMGSMSLIVSDELAIVGDTMFGIFRGSVLPPFAEDKDLMLKSWGYLLNTNCSVFLPSHGEERSRSLLQKQHEKS